MALKVLVIGGVALGPKAACRCKRLLPDSDVTILEQGSYISYGGCGIPYYISGEVGSADALRSTSAGVIRDEAFFEDMKDVKVLTHTRALSIDRARKTVQAENTLSGEKLSFAYDKLVIATGSSPRLPDIPGAHLANVSTVTDYDAALALQAELAERKVENAVIVGAGFIGLEMAVALADMWGINTTVVELIDQVLPAQLSPNLGKMARHDLENLDINVFTGEKVLELRGQDGAVREVVTDRRVLPADHVIFSVGVTPNSAIAAEAGLSCHPRGGVVVDESMRTLEDPDIFAGGDCCVVPHLITGQPAYLPMGSLSNRQGRVIGTNLAGGSARFAGVVGSWCVKLHKMSACGTGLTLRQALAAGFDARSVSMEQLDHAHFFPEKHMTTLEVVVEQGSRRLLGIQGFSEDGMALKARIDPVAAMLQFGKPTIDDLSNLEVSYSPPFAAAMDVVNAAANVADNVLSGMHKSITPDEFVELWKNRAANNYVFVDARPGRAGLELAARHPGTWLAIPLEDMPRRWNEIPRNRPVALICNSGLRAYEVQLMLRKHGIDTLNSSGGMQSMLKRGESFEE